MNGGERKPPPVTLPEEANVELLHLDDAAVHLVYDGAFSLIRRGAFSLLSSRKPFSPLSFISCAVGDFRWPLFSDSPVFQLSCRHFSFLVPFSFYFLTLPDHNPESHYSHLISVLQWFCIFQDLRGSKESDQALWKETSLRMASAISPPPPPVKQRALRVSAVTKLVSRFVAQEEVDKRGHFQESGGSVVAPAKYVIASVRVVADVVVAVEAAALETMLRTHFGTAELALCQGAIATGMYSEMNGAAVKAPPKYIITEATTPLHKKMQSWHLSAAGMSLVLQVIAILTTRAGGAAIA